MSDSACNCDACVDVPEGVYSANGPSPKEQGAATYWRIEAAKARNASDEWEQLYATAARRVLELLEVRDNLSTLAEQLGSELETAESYLRREEDLGDIFIGAIKRYADHAWNDLKRDINERFPGAIA